MTTIFGSSSTASGSSSKAAWNWAGYVVTQPSHSTIRGSFGKWLVPAVTCSAERADALTWVGIGGDPDTDTLYQTGTGSNCVGGHPQYFAFIDHVGQPILSGHIRYSPTWVVLGCHGSTKCSKAVTVQPGDLITASVVDHDLYTRWTVSDTRAGKLLWSHTKDWISHSHRLSAECVEEGPSQYPVANFGQVSFSQCQASDQTGFLHDIAGTLLPSGWSSSQYELKRNGRTLAYPSESTSVTFGSPLQTSAPGGQTPLSKSAIAAALSALHAAEPYAPSGPADCGSQQTPTTVIAALLQTQVPGLHTLGGLLQSCNSTGDLGQALTSVGGLTNPEVAGLLAAIPIDSAIRRGMDVSDSEISEKVGVHSPDLAKLLVAEKQVSTTTTAPSSKFTYIGSISNSGPTGGTITDAYSIGSPVVSNSPPAGASDVIGACNIQSLLGSVYIPGTVTITLSDATLPENISIRGGDIQYAGETLEGEQAYPSYLSEAVEVSGVWYCSQQDDVPQSAATVEMQPGQNMTLSIWVIGPSFVSNNNPTFSASANPDWSFVGSTTDTDLSASSTSASGPHAFVCTASSGNDTDLLPGPAVSLFATPPFMLNFTSGNANTCSSP